jgi:hypothetical protein
MQEPFVHLPVTTLSEGTPGYLEEIWSGIVLTHELDTRFTAEQQGAFGYTELMLRSKTKNWEGCPDGVRGRGGSTGFPGLHHMLRWAMLTGKLDRIRSILATGIRTDIECMHLPDDVAGHGAQSSLTAMQMAVHLDSRAGLLELLPVLAAFGNVYEVASGGFTLLKCASHPVVIDYLLDQGVLAHVINDSGVSLQQHIGQEAWSLIERWLIEQKAPAAQGEASAVRRI